MAIIKRNALVCYSPAEMYALVNDVAAYPSFLPWCRSTDVISATDTEITATIDMARGALNRSFTTRNSLHANQSIELHLVDGPFKKLHGFWHFGDLNHKPACKVSLELEFEFENRMLEMVAGPIFTTIANGLVESFCKRAVDVYGERHIGESDTE